ncbi:MAG: hypothetical protein HY710_04995, partial [Candidatus Latescibacteria bacterium]|nr:hypothetical protein [Candidatus Latescibacterota bacterium]
GLLLVSIMAKPGLAIDFTLDDQQGTPTRRDLSDPRLAAAVERVKQRGISGEDARALVNRMVASGTGSDEIVAVLNGLERSVATGVPPKLLFDKALEGVAKGIPPSRLIPALNAHGQRLRVAARSFDKLTAQKWAAPAVERENAVLRLTGAMSHGTADGVIEQIINGAVRSPNRAKLTLQAVVTAVEVYGDLVSRRVPARQAASIVDVGLERAWPADEFREAVTSIDRLVSEVPPDRAADELINAIKQGRSPSDVMRDMQARERERDSRRAVPRAGDDRKTGRKGPPAERPGPRPDRDKPRRP